MPRKIWQHRIRQRAGDGYSFVQGLAAFGSFAPNRSLEDILIDQERACTDLQALTSDWYTLGRDLGAAIATVHEQKSRAS